MICINKKDFQIDSKTVVTFGKFDGIHKGHRKLIEKAKQIAYENKLKLVVCTFRVVDGKKYPYMNEEFINSFDEREVFFERMNIDILVEYPFDDDVAGMEPLEFIEQVVIKQLNAAYVLVGEDWTFGRMGSGNTDILKAAQKLYNYTAQIVEKELYDEREIGSTWIRDEIKAGRMETVDILLGYPYTIIGKVVEGNRLGRTIEFPTANIIPPANKVLPPAGVYASKIYIRGREYFGTTNVGKKPTVSERNDITVETYIFDFDEDIYNEIIEVQLIHFQRPEMKFADIDTLKAQIQRDETFSKEFFLIQTT